MGYSNRMSYQNLIKILFLEGCYSGVTFGNHIQKSHCWLLQRSHIQEPHCWLLQRSNNGSIIGSHIWESHCWLLQRSNIGSHIAGCCSGATLGAILLGHILIIIIVIMASKCGSQIWLLNMASNVAPLQQPAMWLLNMAFNNAPIIASLQQLAMWLSNMAFIIASLQQSSKNSIPIEYLINISFYKIF